MTQFTVIDTILRWSGTKPTVSSKLNTAASWKVSSLVMGAVEYIDHKRVGRGVQGLEELCELQFSSVQSLSHVCCNPMNRSTPGLPVHHQLPEFIQTHVHWVGDAIQPSHPLSSPSPPAPNPSQHQGLFQIVNSSHEVTKVLEFQLQH